MLWHQRNYSNGRRQIPETGICHKNVKQGMLALYFTITQNNKAFDSWMFFLIPIINTHTCTQILLKNICEAYFIKQKQFSYSVKGCRVPINHNQICSNFLRQLSKPTSYRPLHWYTISQRSDENIPAISIKLNKRQIKHLKYFLAERVPVDFTEHRSVQRKDMSIRSV